MEVEEEAEKEVEVEEVKKDKMYSYCRRRRHLAKECFKKQKAEKQRASKNKGAAVNKSNSNTTFADQEKARFAEYMSRAFAVFSESSNGASNAINDPLLYPQGF